MNSPTNTAADIQTNAQASAQVADQHDSRLDVQRVRHPLKMRMLQVRETRHITPRLLRVTLTGDDLSDFVSASFDDHIKVFFPLAGSDRPQLPELGPNGPTFPEGQPKPPARDYTPRRFDTVARELDIEFVLHGDGPASTWAAQARVGQWLGVGGPRGSFVIPDGFDWHCLIGDETALPAVARRLETLPAGTRAVVVLEVEDAQARIPLTSAATMDIHWVCRDGAPAGERLLECLRGLELPVGEGFAWAAAESATVKAVRHHLVGERGLDKRRVRASSYWKQGAVAVHETIDD